VDYGEILLMYSYVRCASDLIDLLCAYCLLRIFILHLTNASLGCETFQTENEGKRIYF